MKEYLPWSQLNLRECLEIENRGGIPSIDLELTAKCSAASCIYCDSMPTVGIEPCVKELSLDNTLKVLREATVLGLKWIYTCGLGEPTEDSRLDIICDFLKNNNISMSMFTNGLFIDSINIAKKLKESNVNIILKMDTFDSNNFDIILGGKGRAKKIYNAIDLLLKAGYTKESPQGCTDLAFSIVPTCYSQQGIPEVVEFCIEHDIIPSVGELEKAGNTNNDNLYRRVGFNQEQLRKIKMDCDLYHINYKRPICPAILTGIHIDNDGNCIVDKDTGFNCKWFLLSDPNITVIGNVKKDSLTHLHKKVIAYRKKCFIENREIIQKYKNVNYIFGGCGGNPKDIIELYKEFLGK